MSYIQPFSVKISSFFDTLIVYTQTLAITFVHKILKFFPILPLKDEINTLKQLSYDLNILPSSLGFYNNALCINTIIKCTKINGTLFPTNNNSHLVYKVFRINLFIK